MERLQRNDEGPLEQGQIDKHKSSDRFSVTSHPRNQYVNIISGNLIYYCSGNELYILIRKETTLFLTSYCIFILFSSSLGMYQRC